MPQTEHWSQRRGAPGGPGTNNSQPEPQAIDRAHFAGGHIAIPTPELCSVWGMLLAGHIRPLDVRTWLAAREVTERRKFAPRGSTPVYEAAELEALIGGGGEPQIRASLRRLGSLGLVRWGKDGPTFIRSPEDLTAPDISEALRLQGLMPRARRTFPMPRRLLRLLAGGVKRSVLATVLGHLVRCPHFTKAAGWDGAGACKASWVAEVFGLSQSAVQEARSFLVNEYGWLIPLEAPQWAMNRFGGRFEVNLAWERERAPIEAPVAPSAEPAPLESGYPRPGNGAKSGYPDSEQNSPSENKTSNLGARPPGPQNDVWQGEKAGEAAARPTLTKVTGGDLRSVPRVMELFTQALESPLWQKRGWAPPQDSYLERLNWAAAARRAHVRGGQNPAGLFVHLVSRRLYEHLSNDDEEAVRLALSRWVNPLPEVGEDTLGRGPGRGAGSLLRGSQALLSKDALILRRIEETLRSRGMVLANSAVDRELLRNGWSEERVGAARAALRELRGAEREAALELMD